MAERELDRMAIGRIDDADEIDDLMSEEERNYENRMRQRQQEIF